VLLSARVEGRCGDGRRFAVWVGRVRRQPVDRLLEPERLVAVSLAAAVIGLVDEASREIESRATGRPPIASRGRGSTWTAIAACHERDKARYPVLADVRLGGGCYPVDPVARQSGGVRHADRRAAAKSVAGAWQRSPPLA
jgi:hypothetical protein